MPVISTVGALSYARTSIGVGDFEYYAIELLAPYVVQSIAFDPTNSSVYYISGYNFPAVRYATSKFTEVSNVPVSNWTTNHNTGSTNVSTTNIAVNPITNNVILCVAGSSNSGLITLNPSTGLKVNSNSYVYENNAGYTDFIIDSSGKPYITGLRTISGSNYLGATYWSKTSYDTSLPTNVGLFRRSGTLNTGGTAIRVSSTNPYVLFSINASPRLTGVAQLNATTLVPSIVKQTSTLIAGQNFDPAAMVIDSNDNIYFISNVLATGDAYIVKWNSTLTTVVWSKKITDCRLTAITLDSSENVYVAGISVSDTRLYIANLDSSGNKIFERVMYPSSAPTIWVPNDIKISGNAMYTVGNFQSGSGNGYIIKLPKDGTIPGSGVYNFRRNLVPSLNYASTTKTYTNFAITPASSSLGGNIGVPTLTNVDLTNTTVSQTTYIADI